MSNQQRSVLDDEFDAVLHLLDRQIIDSEGAMVAKVDDVELTEHPDGTLEVSGLMTGTAAALPRFSPRLLRRWEQMAPHIAARHVPRVIEVTDVAGVGSDVRLRSRRTSVAQQQRDPGRGYRLHRLGALIGAEVRYDGEPAGKVLDVRVRPSDTGDPRRLEVRELVVGHSRPGLLLGYDRIRDRGPAAVAAVVAWLHRHSWVIDIDQAGIDWSAPAVSASGPRRSLRDV